MERTPSYGLGCGYRCDVCIGGIVHSTRAGEYQAHDKLPSAQLLLEFLWIKISSVSLMTWNVDFYLDVQMDTYEVDE